MNILDEKASLHSSLRQGMAHGLRRRYGIFSNVASMFTLPAGVTVIVRVQAWNPDFSIVTVWSPLLKRNVD